MLEPLWKLNGPRIARGGGAMRVKRSGLGALLVVELFKK